MAKHFLRVLNRESDAKNLTYFMEFKLVPPVVFIRLLSSCDPFYRAPLGQYHHSGQVNPVVRSA